MKTKTSAFWMPFTANRKFASQPKMIEGGDGMYYTTEDGRKIIDGTAGLWCCNAGHSRPEIVEAVSSQIKKLDYAPSFQLGHPKAFELAERLVALSPATLDHVFFTNSGSESVDTALKIALAYQQLRGKGQKQRLIGREKGYHGTGFGGISVGGLGNNKRFFGTALATDHLPHTLNSENAFSRGLPEANKNQLAELEAIVALHDASTIAAVIVEPVVGSAGVIVPPKGYLKKLRELCTAHDILLIFDEVITAFGRIGSAFAAQEFEVLPDIITTAKALTSGVIPMGAVFVSDEIHETFMKGPENAIELFHGYTYSGHPVAAAAALACLDIYEKEKLFEHSKAISTHFEDAAHGLANCANVKDVRNYGLMAAIELNSGPSGVGTRAFDVFNKCFFEKDILVRVTGDVIALSPPLIASEQEITQLFSKLAEAINETG
ncbi:aspartate aminotransferase family protein [Pseudomonadales bacterium]|jgi:beta-alanine--pyruvate transaminase|nr:aspartate aminotransferase family protein [Gammaproteobacteria bacterium]MBT7541079.1 aspartate aminotransferase family protein [Gammaproteobacteria bacterium]MDA7727138.1 aspartate aminotransferase family protein [Pseudomonadales bacterium]MDA7832847.1 aspartate aminotransferase family protein [Pseudomonadales bacterium]MDC1017843.1 aspartate aminotransferase family protein [Pseudomonadales bacterium]